MDKNGISYEIIDYSGITNVKFYTSTDNGSYIPFHWHRAVEIIYIQEGELDVIVESSSHTLHPGDCILINANIIHSTKCTVPNKAIVLQIPLDFMEKYIPNVQQLVFFWDYQTKDPVKKTKIEMLKTTLEQLQIIDDIRPDGFILRFNSLIFELLFQLYHNFRVKVFQSDLSQQKKDLERLEITAKTDFGEIDVPDTMENLMQKEEDEQSFSYVPDQPAGRITLMTKDGDISLEND